MECSKVQRRGRVEGIKHLMEPDQDEEKRSNFLEHLYGKKEAPEEIVQAFRAINFLDKQTCYALQKR